MLKTFRGLFVDAVIFTDRGRTPCQTLLANKRICHVCQAKKISTHKVHAVSNPNSFGEKTLSDDVLFGFT